MAAGPPVDSLPLSLGGPNRGAMAQMPTEHVAFVMKVLAHWMYLKGYNLAQSLTAAKKVLLLLACAYLKGYNLAQSLTAAKKVLLLLACAYLMDPELKVTLSGRVSLNHVSQAA